MTEMDFKRAELKQKKEEAQKDRELTAREGSKNRGIQFLNTTVGTMGKLVGKSNHPEWYRKNESLVRDAASISFSTPLGSYSNAPAGVISGIMTIDTHPVLPKSINSDNADFAAREILQAFRSQYAQIRKANSGAKNYEYLDLARYTLAIQSVYNALADARRVYGLLRKFDAHNRFVGDKLIESLGWDPADLRGNSAQFRERINYYQKMIQSFALPNINTITHRQAWMFSNVFKDSAIKRSQLYAYKLCTVYTITSDYDSTSTNATVLSPVVWTKNTVGTPSGLTLKQVFQEGVGFDDQMRLMVQTLLSDPYAGIISGDIMKAYGDKALPIVFDDLPIDYETPFTYSEDTLTQIAGIQTIGADTDPTADAPFVVRQVKNGNEYVLTQELPYTFTRQTDDNSFEKYAIPYMINSYKDNVTPDDVMVATRMGTISKLHSDTTHGLHFKTIVCGTEVASKMNIYFFNIATNEFSTYALSSINVTVPTRTNIPKVAQFDWMPQWCVLPSYSSNDFKSLNTAFSGFVTDLHNFAFIDEKVLSRLHEVAATSLYGLLTM